MQKLDKKLNILIWTFLNNSDVEVALKENCVKTQAHEVGPSVNILKCRKLSTTLGKGNFHTILNAYGLNFPAALWH